MRRKPDWARLALLALPALVAALLYLRTLGYAFVWDDLDLIVHHQALRSAPWQSWWFADYWQAIGGGSGMWRPMALTTFALDLRFAGNDPAWFHFVNLVLHAATSTLVALLAVSLGAEVLVAAAAGVLFATAPAATESVAWISGRTDLLCTFGVLSMLWCAAHRAHGRRWRVASLALAAIALLSKETAVVLPALLLAPPATDTSASVRTRLKAIVPALVLVVLWIVAHRAFADPLAASAVVPAEARGHAAALVFAHLAYLWPWAAHAPLLTFVAPNAMGQWAAWGGLVLVSGALAVGLWRAAKWSGPLALVFLPLFPLAAAVLLEPQARLVERALYLPLAGVALGCALLGSRVRPRVMATAMLLWAAAQSFVTLPVMAAWRDESARISRVGSVHPEDLDAALALADLQGSEQRNAEAIATLDRAEQIRPGDARIAVARAALALRQGDARSALRYTEQAAGRDPGVAGVALLRAKALGALGRRDEALAVAREWVTLAPADPQARAAWGHALLWAGDWAAARAPLAEAHARLPADPALAYDLGVACARLGLASEAVVALESAVALDPRMYDAWLVLAEQCSRQGDRTGARAALSRAESLPQAADGRAAALRASRPW